jgi:hypothetical protein
MLRVRGMGAIAGGAALIFALSACGNETPSTTKSPQVESGLARFLLQANEEPGFSPSSEPETFSGVEAFVNEVKALPAEAKALRENGFKTFVVVRLEGARGDAGLSNVSEFATEAGARRHLAYLQRTLDEQTAGAKEVKRFDIPAVPTAFGWLAWKPNEYDAANVNWVQGRCLMVLGNGGSGEHAGLPTSFISPLSTGVKAIFERTEGECP